MHIAEGVLSPPVLAVGAVCAIAGLAYGLRCLKDDKIVGAGLLAAIFFVGSLIHMPIGFASAHLLLLGLVGVFLGWAAFPAIFVALALQAVLFQYGGITTLGVNTASMGCGAVGAWHVFHFFADRIRKPLGLRLGAFLAGFLGVALSALLTSCALAFTAEGFKAAAAAIFLAHLPVMIAEGFITMLTVGFIERVKPQMLDFSRTTGMAQGSLQRNSA